MTYEMKSLRKEDVSLYMYIKDTILRDFREIEEYVDLVLMSELSSSTSYVYECSSSSSPDSTARGRGWVYFDSPSGGRPCEPYTSVSGLNGDGDPAFGTPEQSNNVTLYNTTSSGLEVVDWKEYMVDYVDGRIISTVELTSPKVTFMWNYVSVVDEWATIEASEPPVVVVDVSATEKTGYQLGGGKKSFRTVTLHVFANNPAERNDIVESLYDGLYLRSCPIYELPTGTVLDYDGTFYGRRDLLDREPNPDNKLTYLFDRSMPQNVSKLHFDSVKAKHVSLPILMTRNRDEIMSSDLNAYRSQVFFDMYSYDDRTTGIEY